VLGGGHIIVATSGNEGDVSVVRSWPLDNDTWEVVADESDSGDVTTWSLQAFVICASV
jgi:hypothetical protein